MIERFTHCFAVPVRDASGVCLATLCLVTAEEDGRRHRGRYLDALLRGAADLSARLGLEPDAADPRARAGAHGTA